MIWEKYIQDLYDSENRSKDTSIEKKMKRIKKTKYLLYKEAKWQRPLNKCEEIKGNRR